MMCPEIDGKVFAEVMVDGSEEFEVANAYGYKEKNSKMPVIVPVTKGESSAKYALVKETIDEDQS